MSIRENTALVRRWVDEVVNKHDPDAATTFFPSDFLSHQPGGTVHGLMTWRTVIADYLDAFPDYRIEIEAAVAQGDLVATRWVATGTHEGTFRGIAPTGEKVTVRGMEFDRVADGKIAETWSEFDWHGFLHRLGAGASGRG